MTYPTNNPLAGAGGPLLNDPVDVSGDFTCWANTFFAPSRLTDFDPDTGRGTAACRRLEWRRVMAFNRMTAKPMAAEPIESPAREYDAEPSVPFALQFINERPPRLRVRPSPQGPPRQDADSLMLDGPPRVEAGAWRHEPMPWGHRYTSAAGRLDLHADPWRIELFDAAGKPLTQTLHPDDAGTTLAPLLPFGYVRRASDFSRGMRAAFALRPGERIYGCGESFTALNKRGQKLVLFSVDANGAETDKMYKPIPFFLSDRGYGMFVHTSAPVTCDFGRAFSGAAAVMTGEGELDLFCFLGDAKAVLGAYTALTGRPPLPPLWSFGLWMSRITYASEVEVRDVAAKLREHRIGCDVIHLDTGWFETDWRCDYRFDPSRFDDPAKMIADLRDRHFRVCLWQLPYFVPKNVYYRELIEQGLHVKARDGGVPFEDAVLDFSNPRTVRWYQDKLRGLLALGVSAIKVDFGEAAPVEGHYASGATGFHEHNLYPLRYNQAVAEISRAVTGESIIWARSAWAGSQRYPVHWGGDPSATDTGLAASLRGGLSLGLSGFTFWSNDIGGFYPRTPEPVLRRWLGLGLFSSHARLHGLPPTEPWTYSPELLDTFRRTVETRYRLIPYIYAQAKLAADAGHPLLRPLFVEFPDDPGAWRVEDAFLLGSDLLVAPLTEDGDGRDVYLPGGAWVDYQTGRRYGRGWHRIEAGDLPVVLLVRAGRALPMVPAAPSTDLIDWDALELVAFGDDDGRAVAMVFTPGDTAVRRCEVDVRGAAGRHA